MPAARTSPEFDVAGDAGSLPDDAISALVAVLLAIHKQETHHSDDDDAVIGSG